MKSEPIDFKAVIFDMDGVVVNSEPLHERAFQDIAREIGFGDNHGLRFADYIGRSDQELWKDFVARNHPRQTLAELLAMKRGRTLELMRSERPLFPGATRLIRKMSECCLLALATGSERAVAEAVLDLDDLRGFFRAVVTGSDVTHGKPAPDVFLKTAELLGVERKECWVIEDSKPGVAGARAAGMRVVAITNTHPREELGAATVVVETYEAIEQLLLKQRPADRQ